MIPYSNPYYGRLFLGHIQAIEGDPGWLLPHPFALATVEGQGCVFFFLGEGKVGEMVGIWRNECC